MVVVASDVDGGKRQVWLAAGSDPGLSNDAVRVHTLQGAAS